MCNLSVATQDNETCNADATQTKKSELMERKVVESYAHNTSVVILMMPTAFESLRDHFVLKITTLE